MLELDDWLCLHRVCLPATHGELLAWELCGMAGFALIAIVIAVVRLMIGTGPFAVVYVCRSGIGNGGTFVLSVMFMAYPFSAHVRDLFSFNQVMAALVVGSFTVALLQVAALFRVP